MSKTSATPSEKSVQRQLLDLLLQSMFKKPSDGRIHKFMYGPPGSRDDEKRFGIEVQYSRRGLQNAALFARKNGPRFLVELPISQIEDRLTKFVADNYWHISDQAFMVNFTESYADFLHNSVKVVLEGALSRSNLFHAEDGLWIYPLVPLRVEQKFDCGVFFMIAPGSLSEKIPKAFGATLPEQFPPFPEHQGLRYSPTSWLGIRSQSAFSARKIRASVLGAVALLPHRFERYMFTGRKVFGGQASFEGVLSSYSFGQTHMPPLWRDLIITDDDKVWLEILEKKLKSNQKKDRKHLKALEYFFRAWPVSSVERFPTLFMAIDAIFGDASQATQAVASAILPVMGPDYDYTKLRKMLGLRASVMHGGAPDVVESDKYHDYYVEYGEDPIRDLEFIASSCLRQEVFQDTMTERPQNSL